MHCWPRERKRMQARSWCSWNPFCPCSDASLWESDENFAAGSLNRHHRTGWQSLCCVFHLKSCRGYNRHTRQLLTLEKIGTENTGSENSAWLIFLISPCELTRESINHTSQRRNLPVFWNPWVQDSGYSWLKFHEPQFIPPDPGDGAEPPAAAPLRVTHGWTAPGKEPASSTIRK